MRHARLAAVLGAAIAIALPAQAFGQAPVGNGSAASEYGDYVPTTSGHTSTPTHHSSSSTHSAPSHSYTPPVRHTYTPPVQHTYTAPVQHSSPTYSAPSTSAASAQAKHHRHHRSHPAQAAAKAHHAAKAQPKPGKAAVTVPASSPTSVDGGSHQLVWLGLAMITMTVAVFLRAGLRRRHGSV